MNPAHAFYSDSIIEYLVPKKRKHAALISAPKSGSTWLQNSIFPVLCKEKNIKLIDLRNHWRTKKKKI